jgi:hypothetical protein
MINKLYILILVIYSVYCQSYSFVKTQDEITKYYNISGDQIQNAQVLISLWETKPEIIKGLLPKFLQPSTKPYVFSYIINPNSTNYGTNFKEAALFVRAVATYSKIPITVEGWYCVAGDTDNDMTLIRRREKMGFPYKVNSFEILADTFRLDY